MIHDPTGEQRMNNGLTTGEQWVFLEAMGLSKPTEPWAKPSSQLVYKTQCLCVFELLRNGWTDFDENWYTDTSQPGECPYLYVVTL